MKSRTWRLNNLYYILDESGNKVKFRMNDVQVALYVALWWLNVVLKSRQHGVTTFVCIFFLDACLFKKNVRAGIVAHKLNDAKKIFRDKVKFAYDNLPESIKEKITLIKDDACELLLSNNSGIYVGTSMRSGTLQYLHVSEYGWLCAHAAQKAREIKTGAMETVHEGGVIIVESTAEGVGNDFHKMCEEAEKISLEDRELSEMEYKFHFFPWYSKPQNQVSPKGVEIPEELTTYFNNLEIKYSTTIGPTYQAWYTLKKKSLGQDMYREHPSTPEESFMASIEGTYYGSQMTRVQEEGRICSVPHDESAIVHTFWDTGDIHTSIWFAQFIRQEIRLIDYYEDNSGIGLPGYAKVLQSKPYIYGDYFAGPDIVGSNRKSVQTGKTILDTAAELGIHFTAIEPHAVADGIEAVRGILNKCVFDKIRCEFGIKCILSYRKDKNELLSTEDTVVFKNSPLHDWASHGADGLRHLAMAYRYERIGDERIGYPGSVPEPREQTTEQQFDLLKVG